MLTLKFLFIPPTANHAQKSRIIKGKGKAPYMVRYNTPKYNDFKQQVQTELDKLDDATRAELVALLQAPHMVFITVASPKFKTKKGEWSLTGGDVDNRIKQALDSIYKPLKANDALIISIVATKKVDNEEWMLITFKQYQEEI
jgi:Holliday junction resolvase RusA-like endonuclease